MSQNGIHYHISPQNLLASVGQHWIALPADLAHVDADVRAVLVRHAGPVGADSPDLLYGVSAPTWDAVLAAAVTEAADTRALVARVRVEAEAEAAAVAVREAERVERAAVLAARVTADLPRLLAGEGEIDTPTAYWYQLDGNHVLFRDCSQPELAAQIRDESERRLAATHAAQNAAAAAVAEARAEWIRAHGSTRLNKILDAGMLEDSTTVYTEERISVELPDWLWWGTVKSRVEESNRRNPLEAEVDALLAARRDLDPEAELICLRDLPDESDPCGDESSKWWPALRVRLPWDRERHAIRYL